MSHPYLDSSTQPTPVVQPPIPPPKKRMSRSNKLALACILSLVAVFVLIVAVIEVQPGAPQLSSADQNATATVLAADIAATNVAEQDATSVAQLSSDLTEQANVPTPIPTTPVASTGADSTQSSGPWSITINSIKTVVSDNEFEQPKAGNRYADINFTALNTDSSTQDMNIFDFTLRDDSGTPYTPTLIDNAADPTGTVLSGQKIRGDLVFEIPKSIHSVTLQFDVPGDFDNSQVVQWNLTI